MGQRDEVAVFNQTLTAARIQPLYDHGHQLSQVQLEVAPAGTGLNLDWPQGTLFPATNLAGPWSALTNGRSPWVVVTTNRLGFFRVRLR